MGAAVIKSAGKKRQGRKCEYAGMESAQSDEISKQEGRPGTGMDGEEVMKDVLIK